MTAAALDFASMGSSPTGLARSTSVEGLKNGRTLAKPPKQSKTVQRVGGAVACSAEASKGAAPRVFPIVVVLNDETGREVWHSGTQLVSEQLLAADLLHRDTLRSICMPDTLVDTVQPGTHAISVLDINSGGTLQVANLTGTKFKSLQRHCNHMGELTISITPIEDSEDAFEGASSNKFVTHC